MPIPNFYSAWLDPVFYASAVVFAFGLTFLVYSIKKRLEVSDSLAFGEISTEKGGPVLAQEGLSSVALAKEEAPDSQHEEHPKAEVFVKGIFDNLKDMDVRLKNIEGTLSREKSKTYLATTYLEDLLNNCDEIDKEKIKARIEFLIFSLKQ
ncbi:MAG: hypothetical protein HY746_00780 [Elusimicrobia bacterium]|nr:hypothetical protein [Elusimicrobiota bacterium]